MKKLYIIWVMLFLVTMIGCNQEKDHERTINSETDNLPFQPKGVPPGSESDYKISLKMKENGEFHVNTSIQIKNTSDEKWDKLIFYFIPNMFTEENSPALQSPSTIDIKKVNVNGENIDYSLKKDTLELSLTNNVDPKETSSVDILYSFTLPDKGLRFTKNDSNFYLAQWYPMVPTYRNGWNKEKYKFKGETYHTTYSNFQIEYEVPEKYTVVTSSDEDGFPSKNKNKIKINNVKEVFIAILDNPTMIEDEVEGTNLRVFGLKKDQKEYEETLELASEAFDYFQTTIGPYQHKQLDIILEELGMEYPGIVTAGSIYNRKVNKKGIERMIVHEIAHQWFYGMISNDPYHDPWLDEGMADFSTSLFLSNCRNLDIDFDKGAKFYKDHNLTLPVDLSLNEYPPEDTSSYIYGKAATMLGQLFQLNGGTDKAETFLNHYFELYQFKEVNTDEFLRYLKYYLKIEDKSAFENWISKESAQDD